MDHGYQKYESLENRAAGSKDDENDGQKSVPMSHQIKMSISSLIMAIKSVNLLKIGQLVVRIHSTPGQMMINGGTQELI
jgi:hypothetical protein